MNTLEDKDFELDEFVLDHWSATVLYAILRQKYSIGILGKQCNSKKSYIGIIIYSTFTFFDGKS